MLNLKWDIYTILSKTNNIKRGRTEPEGGEEHYTGMSSRYDMAVVIMKTPEL